MKPGLIQVFDGLRITTQHMNHLQGSFHSALQDIRQILGAGQVHSGFEVVKEGENKIKVMPGLAFDFERNRIVCDEPKTVDVSFEDIDETQYVYVKYKQVEDGVVEGKPTLIWDTCTILTLKAQPEQKDNIVPIAALIRKEKDETFEIVSLIKKNMNDADKKDNDVISEKTEIKTGVETKVNKAVKAGALKVEKSLLAQSKNVEAINEIEADETANVTSIAESMRDTAPIESVKISEGSANATFKELDQLQTKSAPLTPVLSIEQGVFQLNTENEKAIFLENEILEPFKEKLGMYSETKIFYLPTLAEMTVKLNFRPISLTFDTVLTAEIGFNQISESDYEGKLTYKATGHGEATVSGEIVSQYGVAAIQSQFTEHTLGASPLTSEITQGAVLQIAFKSASTFSKELAWLEKLGLMISAGLKNETGFHIISRLVWMGKVTEEMIGNLKRQEPHLRWRADVAWKAFGVIKHQ